MNVIGDISRLIDTFTFRQGVPSMTTEDATIFACLLIQALSASKRDPVLSNHMESIKAEIWGIIAAQDRRSPEPLDQSLYQILLDLLVTGE